MLVKVVKAENAILADMPFVSVNDVWPKLRKKYETTNEIDSIMGKIAACDVLVILSSCAYRIFDSEVSGGGMVISSS